MPVTTIRYYEEIGLLEPITTRSESGYRLFNSQVLNCLAFIKRAQSLGLRLSEIHSILEVYDSGELPCGTVKQLLLLNVFAGVLGFNSRKPRRDSGTPEACRRPILLH
jgi:DNA-binding transcriptional MerR regulator